MPRTDWVLAQLGGGNWFSSFDLSQGFDQIQDRRSDIQKTAFICHRCTFEYKRMPFGVAGQPGTFQTLTDKVLLGIKDNFRMAFLDDILVCSRTFEEYLVHIREVLRRISVAGLAINRKKVPTGRHTLQFLGHVVSPGEFTPDPAKTSAIKQYPAPTNVKKLQAFLGLMDLYLDFSPSFSDVAKSLTQLLRHDSRWRWGNDQEHAFMALKAHLNNAVLALPDPNRPFIVETDGSGVVIGAVLLQEFDGVLRPIFFITRTLTDAKRRYTVKGWECLGVVWALEKFRSYLEYTKFEVHCDHSSLV